jgi:hypothetical protein
LTGCSRRSGGFWSISVLSVIGYSTSPQAWRHAQVLDQF